MPQFIAYISGINSWTGSAERTVSTDVLTDVLAEAKDFEDPEIILNGNPIDTVELRRWALIIEGCQL